MNEANTRICILGSLIGQNAGHVTTQGQKLAEQFRSSGYDVITASSKLNRAARLTDIALTIFRNRKKIDVLVLEVYSGLGFLLADLSSALSKSFRIPTVFVLHGGSLPAFADKYPNWTKRVLERADFLAAPSSFLASALGKKGFDVNVIPNVIDLDSYACRIRRSIAPKLLWMRSFHRIYNPQMALDVLSFIKQDHPKAELAMCGPDKGLENEIKESAFRMGLADSVKFLGFLNEAEKRKQFAAADIYLNTNLVDNTPVSVIEACAMGLPVVATDVGGVSHLIVDGQSGILVPDGGTREMADAVKRLLQDPDLTERLSQGGRALAEKSSWNNVHDVWDKVLTVLAKPAAHTGNMPKTVSARKDITAE